jgi:predicted phage terminase large subunit-like protein
VADAASAELARRGLLDFARRMHPAFQAPPHIEYVATMLEAVERGDIRRLAISVQPGSGKSTLLQLFSGWYLGRDGRRKIITTSAGAELAERNSRATRSLFTEDAWPFGVRLSTETTAQHRWDTNAGGGLVAIGQGALITGWRANLIVCDDLQNDAGTENERASLWQWYREVLGPRLEPRGAIVVVQTRWSEDDLLGRLIESDEGAQWSIVNLPAIAGEGDVLGRRVGEALWPERFGIEELEKRRTSMGSRAFSCQFLGAPVPAAGTMIKTAWLQRYAASELPEHFDALVMAVDCASKTGVANDYSAIALVGASKDAFFVLDVVRRKVEYPELVRMLASAYEAHKPSSVYVEDASSGTVLLQELKRETRLPVVGVRAAGSKIARVEGVLGLFEAGRVRLPIEAPWLVDFEREVLAFPNAKHDDQVDALVLALSQLRERLRQKPFALRVPQGGF